MDTERTQTVPNTAGGNGVPHKGKRLLMDVRRTTRRKYWLRAVGISLFLACPWLFYLLMVLCEDTWGFIPMLVTGPIILYGTAFLIHRKGENSEK